MSQHELYMSRCIDLAQRAYNQAAPNPLVGAVLVYQHRVIGEGYHQQYGQAHAEVNAIKSVQPRDHHLINQATLYVSLEPCSFHGKTPACTSMIIEHSIPKVVIGTMDPHKKVAGNGIKILKKHGIKVIIGILEEKCIELNKKAFTSYQLQRPYVFLKWAQTQNGYFAPNNRSRTMISNELTRLKVHNWRRQYHSILVGYNTALNDDPALTNRYWYGGNQPIRVVLDPQNKLPKSLTIFDNEVLTYHFIDRKAKGAKASELLETIDFQNPHWPQLVLSALHEKDIQSVMIEGGAKTLQAFIDIELWDEIAQIIAPIAWQEGIKAPQIHQGVLVEQYSLKEDSVNLWKHERNNYLI